MLFSILMNKEGIVVHFLKSWRGWRIAKLFY